jgi:hypothetical protein
MKPSPLIEFTRRLLLRLGYRDTVLKRLITEEQAASNALRQAVLFGPGDAASVHDWQTALAITRRQRRCLRRRITFYRRHGRLPVG